METGKVLVEDPEVAGGVEAAGEDPPKLSENPTAGASRPVTGMLRKAREMGLVEVVELLPPEAFVTHPAATALCNARKNRLALDADDQIHTSACIDREGVTCVVVDGAGWPPGPDEKISETAGRVLGGLTSRQDASASMLFASLDVLEVFEGALVQPLGSSAPDGSTLEAAAGAGSSFEIGIERALAGVLVSGRDDLFAGG